MPGVSEKMKREDLFHRIVDTMREWPNLDRHIFAQAHYRGQSIETISRSLNLDVRETRLILQHRDRELYTAVRKFREVSRGRSQPTVPPPAGSTNSLLCSGCCI